MATSKKEAGEKLLVKNRRATFDYAVEEVFEAGIVLVGSEVKSIREGHVEIGDAFASIDRGEAWIKQMYVAPFTAAKAFPHEPRRSRKLLLSKREISKLDVAISRGGYTVVPLRLYLKDGKVKLEIGLAKGKKAHDKRADIAKKTADREARDEIGRGRKGFS